MSQLSTAHIMLRFSAVEVTKSNKLWDKFHHFPLLPPVMYELHIDKKNKNKFLLYFIKLMIMHVAQLRVMFNYRLKFTIITKGL